MWLRHHFQGPGHQVALLAAALTREAGAAVTVRTYWAWETTATLHLVGGVRGTGVPTREERGGDISCRQTHSLFKYWNIYITFQNLHWRHSLLWCVLCDMLKEVFLRQCVCSRNRIILEAQADASAVQVCVVYVVIHGLLYSIQYNERSLVWSVNQQYL